MFSENFDAYDEGDAPEVANTYSGDVTIVAAGEKESIEASKNKW